jgi:D-arabinose 1-dehydrogenase-like Zn-dependent alcohol dehydrogenase
MAPAETVASFGDGGPGHLALQYARIVGGFVIAVDIEGPHRCLKRDRRRRIGYAAQPAGKPVRPGAFGREDQVRSDAVPCTFAWPVQ